MADTFDDAGVLAAGVPAPDFTLDAAPDRVVSLRELRGAPAVLVFYPADWNPVCGDELAVFNQALPMLREHRASVLGISVDGVWCHQAFAAARNLHFSLLADFEPKGAVSKAYGAYDAAHGFCRRALFVIDRDGRIAWSYVSPTAVNPGVDGVLDALEALPA